MSFFSWLRKVFPGFSQRRNLKPIRYRYLPIPVDELESRTVPAIVYANPTDYLPGQTANLFAEGFQHGEAVQFQVSNLTNGTTYVGWAVTDNSAEDLNPVAGDIQTGWLVPQDALNTTLQVDVTGLTSGLTAQNTFTDGSVTAATGGTAISADTNTTDGTATWTTLTGPTYTETASGNVGVGTIVLSPPAGFVFDSGGTAPTVLLTSGNAIASRNINGLANNATIPVTVAPDGSTLTITITSASNTSESNTLTWQNVRVRPTSGTTLASGNITSSGTSAIDGVTSGTTNWGTLTEVPGAVTQMTFGQQPTNAAALSAISPAITVQLRDQFDNVATNNSIDTVTLDIANNPASGTIGGTTTVTAVSGVATFSDVSISAAGTGYTLQATTSASGVSAATSSSFDVTSATHTAITATVLATGNWNAVDTWTAVAKSGTITTATNSTTVTGVGTSFLTQFAVGDRVLRSDGTTSIGIVASISSNLSMTLTANASNANTGAAFSGRSIPTVIDAVVIPAAPITVTIPTGYAASAASVTYTASGDSQALTLAASSSSLYVAGNVTINRPTGNDTAALNVDAGTVTVGGNVTLAGTATNTNRIARIQITTGSMTIAGDLTFVTGSSASNVIDMDTGAGTLNLGGVFTATVGTLSSNATSAVNFNGTVAQTIPIGVSSIVYSNLYVNNTSASGATISAAISATNVTGSVSVQSGTLSNGGFAIVGGAGDTFQVANGATFKLTGTSGMVTGFTLKTFGATSTVDYAGTAQTVSNEAYGHLTLSGSGTKTMPATTLTTLGNFTTSGTASATAAAALVVGGNFTVGTGTTFNAATFSHQIKGDFSNSGTFTASTSTVTFNGTSGQTLTGATTFNNLTLNNGAGLTLDNDATVNGALTFTSGNLTTGSNTLIVGSSGSVSGAGASSGYVVGNLRKSVAAGSDVAQVFEVGTGSAYTPVTTTFASVSVAGAFTASAIAGDHPDTTAASSGLNDDKSVNAYWRLTNGSTSYTTYTAAFTYSAAITDGAAAPSSFILRQKDGGVWSSPTLDGTPTATGLTASGISTPTGTNSNDFAIGQVDALEVTLAVAPAIAEGDTGSLTVSYTDPNVGAHTATINWGDGTTVETLAVTSGQVFTHPYADGTFARTIDATVSNDGGTAVASNATLTVTNVAPSVTAFTPTDATIDEGGVATVTLGFTDPATTNDTYTATIQWGDSTSSVVTGVTSGQTYTHTYADGTNARTVAATVNDEDGGTSTVASATITVNNVAPNVIAFGLDTATIGEGGSVSATVNFTDPALTSDTYTATIAWGDATSVYTAVTNGQVFSHTYADGLNTYVPSITVNDEDGGTSSPANAFVTVTNVAPTITTLSAPASVDEGSAASLTIDFADPAGASDSYTASIDWGDSTVSVVTAVTNGQVFTHAYADGPNDYVISATIEDEDLGTSAPVTASVSVANVAPSSVVLVGAPTADENTPYSLTVNFVDPANANDTYTATIDWGDSAPEVIPAIANGQVFTHRYADGPSSFTVGVVVSDSDGASSSLSTKAISVANVAPSITALNLAAATVAEGSQATVTLDFSDPALENDSYTATIDWGDGLSDVVTAVTSGQTFTHPYRDGPAVRNVAATVNDEDNGTSTVVGTNVTVTNVAPSIVAFTASIATVAEAGTASVTLTFSDPANANDTYTATIDWGDSAPEVVTAISSGQVFTHVYDDGPNSYVVSVTVNDEDGGTSSPSDVTLEVTNVAPSIASLVAPASVAEATPVSLTVNFSDPAGSEDTYTVTIDWSEGAPEVFTSVASGAVFTHVYLDGDRVFPISAVVNDEDGGTSSLVETSVTVTNVAPAIASLSLDLNSIDEGDTATLAVFFADTPSDTHDATISWGDGTSAQVVTAVSSGQTFTHVYADNATAITVTVTDDDGDSDTESTAIAVANVAPSLAAPVVSPTAITEGETATLTVSFSDPGIADTHTVSIVWGDGSSAQVTAVVSGQTFTHVYADNAATQPQTILVTVTDDDGDSSLTESATISVANAAPTLADPVLTPASINEGATATLTVSFTDPGADSHTATINWGDGSSAQVVTAATSGQTFTHVFSDNPTPASLPYVVDVTVTDDDGASSATKSATITVANVAPSITSLTAPTSVNEGSSFDLTVDFNDPGGISDVYDVTVDWGDGVSTYNAVNSGDAFSHAYPDGPSNYTASVIVSDDDGGASTVSTFEVSVANVAPSITTLFLAATTVAEGSTASLTINFTDPANESDTYTATIDWGDSAPSVVTAIASGQVFTHVYADGPSDYTVSATVTDSDDAASSVAIVDLAVTNVAPSITSLVLAATTIQEGSTASVTVNFDDPAGASDTYTATIHWGDSAPSVATAVSSGQVFTHLYVDGPSAYTVSATVRDSDDDSSPVASVNLSVTNGAPTITSLFATTSTIAEGGTASLTVLFFDPAGAFDTYTATVDWGNATSVYAGVGSGSVLTHVYADGPNEHFASVTISDSDGADSAPIAVNFTVLNVAPSITSLSLAAATIAEGGTATVSISFTDPAGGNDTYTATIDWGDSAPEVVTAVSSGQVYEHVYADGSNDYTVTATIADSDDAASTEATVELAVTNVAPSITSLVANVVGEGSPTSLTLSFDDPAGISDAYTATIDWGDGSSATVVTAVTSGQVFTHVYADDSTVNLAVSPYVATAIVNDEDGGTSGLESALITVTNVAPSITSLAAPATVAEGSTASVTVNFNDPAGASDTYTATIDWGDSAPEVVTAISSGQVFTHVYADGPDAYTVSATVNDEDGGTSAVASVDVAVTNVAPSIATFAIQNATIAEGGTATVTVDFTDPAGVNDTYTATIDWGDSAPSVAAVSAGQVFTHVYADGPNDYTVSATVVDSDGDASSTETVDLAVTNVAPSIASFAIQAATIAEGGTATVTIDFTDPAGVNDTYTATIDWGDSAPSVVTAVSSGQTFTHVYADGPIDYTVSATVTDSDGDSSTAASVDLAVTNVAPSITSFVIENATIAEGGTATVTVNFNDPAGLNDAYTATIDWGDSAPSVAAVTNGQTFTHVYADGPIDYTVSATVVDSDGDSSSTETVDLAVTNVAPSITSLVLAASTVGEGSTATVTVNFNDPAELNDTYTATIDWGDSAPSVAAVTNGQTFTHVYADGPTDYTVSATVVDSDGESSSTETVDLTVTNVAPSIASLVLAASTVGEGSTATLTVNFDDPAGLNDTYTATIDWGDSAPSVAAVSSGQTFTHVYADGPSAFTVSVTVNDEDDGTSAVASVNLAVTNVAPSITSFAIQNATIAEAGTATVTINFTDPAGVNDTYTATIDWGDSASSVAAVTDGQTFTHVYADGPDAYTVSATVTDSDGDSSSAASVNLSVTNVAPSITSFAIETATIAEGGTATVTVSFTDPADANDTYTATIDWGDSSPSVAAVTSGQVFTHVYADGPIGYTISATVSDSDDDSSSAASVELSVTNVTPSITSLVLAATVGEGSTASLTVNFTDPAGVNDTYTATIDWGDSAPSVAAVTSGQVFTHVYADGPNAYTVSATVTDSDDASSSTASANLSVTNVAPTVTSLNVPAPVSGTPASLTVNFSDPADANDTYTATIDWGDAATSVVMGVTSGQVFTHLYADNLTPYTLSTTVNDEDGGASGVVTATVNVANVPPTIDSLVLATATVGEGSEASLTVNFTDPNVGDTFTATIHWGDSSTSIAAATSGQVFTHAYADGPNAYTVSAIVSDQVDGTSSVASVNLSVTNVAPSITSLVLATATVAEGSTASLTLNYNDPAGANDTYTTTIHWGDGAVSIVTSVTPGQVFSHGYLDGNSAYVISATVKDEDNGTSALSSVNLSVTNVAPSITSIAASPATIDESGTATLSLAFTDPGDDSYTAVINWGDTTISTVTAVTSGETFTHVYKDGTAARVIAATVHDEDGGTSSVSSTTVTVMNVAPSITSIVPSSITVGEGTQALFTLNFTDPAVADDSYTATVVWGDGAVSVITGINSGQGYFHTYADGPNDYTVSVTVNDEDGGTSSVATVNLSVTNVAPSITSLALAAPTIAEGGTATVTVNFTDPANANDTYTATINWGDSTSSIASVTSGQVFTHVYVDGPNAFAVSATVRDSDNATSPAASVNLSVTNVAPSITSLALAAPTIAEGGTATVTVVFTDPANANDTYTATINWGDSTSSIASVTSGQVFTHVYVDGPNAFAVSATVRDSDNATSPAASVNLSVTNVAPSITSLALAAPTIAEGGTATVTVVFSDPANANDTYTATINWGDSATSIASVTSGQAFTHVYVDGPNAFAVSATVRDSDNATSPAASVNLSVTNVAPSIASLALAASTIAEGGTATVTINFTDPANANDTYTATINWGDSAPSVVNGVTSGQAFTHVFADGPNAYTVSATVRDSDNATSPAASVNLSVTNVAPSIASLALAAATVAEGSTASVTLNFSDPAGANDTYTATINWGDSAPSVVNGVTSGQVFTHVFADGPNAYTVSATVRDSDNATSPAASVNLSVTNVAPSITSLSLASTTIDQGQSATLSLSFTDPGTADTHTATITWGDGTSTVLSVTSGQTFNHVYNLPATATVNVSLKDDDNGTTTGSATLVVNNVAPDANDDTANVAEDATLTASGNVLTNDVKGVPTETLTVTAVNGSTSSVGVNVAGTYGTVSISGSGAYVYSLNNSAALVQALAAGATVTDTFSYAITDNEGGSDTATLTVNVGGTNDAPVISAAGNPSVGTFDESVLSGNGILVSDLIASSAPTDMIADVDTGAVEGIAVTGVDTQAAGFTPIADDFNRASLGAGYTTQLGVGFTLNGSVATSASYSITTLDALTAANVAVQADVAVGGSGTHVGLIARYSGSGDGSYYMGLVANRSGVVTVEIWKAVNGSFTMLSQTAAAGAGLLRLETLGGHLRLYYNSVLVGEVSDASISSGGKIGLRGSGGTYDNLRVEPAPAEPFAFTDTFTRASLGTDYVVRTGPGFTLNGATASPSGFSLATYSAISQADVAVQANVTLNGSGSFGGLVARYAGSGDSNLYLGTLANNGTNNVAEIWKNVGGAYTKLTSTIVASGTGLLRLEILGSSLRLFVDGVLRGQVFDGSLTAAGLAGLRGSTGVTFDNFSVSNAPLGAWQYSTNNGGAWNDLGSVSDSSARLLASDANTRVRFVPNPGVSSSAVVPSLEFRAWDRTSGTNGDLASVSTSGGSTAFSTGEEVATESTFVSDSFTGAFANGWTSQVAGLTVSGNQVVSTTGLGVSTFAALEAADVAVEATVSVSASGNFVGVLARYTGSGDGMGSNAYAAFLVNVGGQTFAEIWKNVNGTYAKLTSAPAAATGTLRLEVYGSTLKLFFNGQLLSVAQDSSITAKGIVGVRMGNGGPTLDNFKANALSAPSTTALTDDFNRAALGAGYSVAIGSPAIVANKVSVDSFALVDVNAAKLKDVTAAIDVTLTPDASNVAYAGLVIRHTGTSDQNGYWAAIVQRGAVFTVELWVAAPNYGSSPLASASLTSGTGRLRIDAQGTTLKIFVDGVLKIALTDGSLTGVGDVALRAFKATLDNLSIDAL